MKKTVVIGASTNPERYSYKAIKMLREYGHPVIGVGPKEGSIDDVTFQKEFPSADENVDTISLYIGVKRQPEYYDKIINLSPKRIVFNPGTENPELVEKAQGKGIECLQACTLVLLRTDQF